MVKSNAYKIRNPFVYEGYEGPQYFCDRTDETERLIGNLQNGVNVTLISPRKIGKTALICHAFDWIKREDKNAICIYTDIFHTLNQHDLVQTLGQAIIQERLLDKRNTMAKVLGYFSAWRPTISFDPVTGAPTVSVNIERSHSELTLEGIFNYLKQSGKEIYFAIDEFQTIADYPEKGTEALLRSHIQFIHNVHFIFSGSKLHMMSEMFGSPKRPFYQSTATMSLNPLHEDIYYEFACGFFKAKKGGLDRDVFHRLYLQFDGYTWYLQSVLNQLYSQEKSVTDYSQVQQAILGILTDKSDQYQTLMTFLTDNQFNLLKAIAKADAVPQPQAAEFIRQYDLPSSSSISKALAALTEKDMVYRTDKGYIIYDRFLDLWLKRMF